MRATRFLALAVALTAAMPTTMKIPTIMQLCFMGRDGDQCRKIGPDGPWQGLQIFLGNASGENLFQGGESWVEMFPTLDTFSAIAPTSNRIPAYDPNKSSSARLLHGWSAGDLGNPSESVRGNNSVLIDSFVFHTNLGSDALSVSRSSALNLTFLRSIEWNSTLPNNQSYSPEFGLLSLAERSFMQPGILQQLKWGGEIGSASFGLHIGSAALKQPMSLVFGGYEQNRALGDVAVFDDYSLGASCLLSGLTLGVAKGGSPFNDSDIRESRPLSVWQGVGTSQKGQQAASALGASHGSAVIFPNPGTSLIHLPPGNCEAIAKYLPVTFSKDLQLYTWNTKDSQFKHIVDSPAYIGFVFSDRTAKKVTINVPFKLLNLTLDKPIVQEPVQYFPCVSHDSPNGVWTLGRAFLQGAFLAIHQDQNLLYLAQAPGPDMDQRVVQALAENDTVVHTNLADTFDTTWGSTWNVLDAPVENNGKNNTAESTPEEASHGLARGAIAGIVIGVVAGLAFVVVLAFLYMRRGSQRKAEALASRQEENKKGDGHAGHELSSGHLAHELPVPRIPQEAPGPETRLELG
ncbi:hypothetical protein QQS21_010790 [Conoideocrella luteorostrata]|uniref:Peptidase A1 domain-containing protein n=1 Tax=Conoideocrella luteorostrata TaxID=1105319 RepID=A0AAJ0CEB4_9HYPO|nr:hypothetical protein QQS21_010790 [Conoideocrella luteorostrata]